MLGTMIDITMYGAGAGSLNTLEGCWHAYSPPEVGRGRSCNSYARTYCRSLARVPSLRTNRPPSLGLSSSALVQRTTP